MSTALTVVTCAMTDPDAAALVREMTVEVATLYGDDPDQPSSYTAEMFAPPGGQFLVGYLGGEPVACAAFRRIDDGLAQAHRVFVRPAARGAGIARQLMGHVEAMAAEAGYDTLRLETGTLQPAAMRVYESLGYTPIPAFGPYEDDPMSRCYAKRIG